MFVNEVKHLSPFSTKHCDNSFRSSSIENQLSDGDSETYTSSNQSYSSSSQRTLVHITNEKAKCVENKDSLNTNSRAPHYNCPHMPATYLYHNWSQSAVPIPYSIGDTQDSKEICRYQTPDPSQTSYGSSILNPSTKTCLYPDEKFKTLIAAIFAFIGFMATVTSLVLTHERLPDRNEYGPLPDIVLDNLVPFDWALDWSEYIIMFTMNTLLVMLLFHRHRFIVFRRLFLILGILYVYRAITMYITVLPISSSTYHCDPKMGQVTLSNVIQRIFKVTSGFGLSINGKHVYCGDFIYSGHTVSLVMSYLIIAEYTSEKCWFIHWIFWFLAALGIILLQFAHGHYTIDIVVAYYVTTRIFWTYHTLANNVELKDETPRNYYSRMWWFKIFQYFEKNIGGPVPNEYDWPFWCSKKCCEGSED